MKNSETPREARRGLSDYLKFYNVERPHQALGYRTPEEAYAEAARPSFPARVRGEA